MALKEMVLIRSRVASALKITTMTTAGVAAALLAAGCSNGGGINAGGSGGSQPGSTSLSPAQAVTLASQHAASVNSFATTLNVQMSGTVSGTMVGTMQMRKRPSLLIEARFSKLDFGGTSVPGGMEEILTSKTLYLKMATLQRELGKPWAALPLSALSGKSGVNLSQLTQQAQQNNPMTDVQMLSSAKNLRAVGTETIGGVSTTHYTGSFAASAGLAKLPPSLRSTEQKALQTLGITTFNFNAWIDAQHQIRKIAVTEHGGSEQVAATMQVTGYNQALSVNMPPSSQVKSIPASALGG